jgi:Rho-binding antiterminator
MDEYRPVDNEVLRELEVLAAMKKLCIIQFEAENGGRPEVRSRIMGVYSENDVYYLKTDSGLSIRLDKLLQVDGKPLKKNC